MNTTCPRCGGMISGADSLCPECLKRVALQEAIQLDDSGAIAVNDLLPESAHWNADGSAIARDTSGGADGDRWGDYELLESIGRGAMGTVFKARHTRLNRLVALKVIKLGMDTKGVIARFEAERQALAMMDHPNIATVLDAGATEKGRPYFVMELVRGVKITDFCDENRLPTDARLTLFIQVCHAIQHAHQKGVIHRDIKPSNTLVTVNNHVPVPKVIDFGIAKATQTRLTDHSLFTAFDQFVGTPAYMSPEQAALTNVGVDTRSDIYSLGVLLYELLTGQTPFAQKELLAAGLDEMRRTIRDDEPVKPSTLLTQKLAAAETAGRLVPRVPSSGETTDGGANGVTRSASLNPQQLKALIHLVRGDLDWIVMKCLQKDRTRRYETASELAMDLTRHLNNEPVLARPDTRAYRLTKFVHRHRASVTFAALILFVLTAGLAGTITQARRATKNATQASEQRDFALRQLSRAEAINDLNEFLISDAAPSGKPFTAVELLARAERMMARDYADTDENRVEIFVSIGRQYAVMKEITKASSLLNTAYELSRKLSDPPLRAKAAAALGDAIAMAGDFKRGEQLIQEALDELGDEPNYALFRAFCLERGSHVARERGDIKVGVERIEEAQRILKESHEGSALRQLGLNMSMAEAYRLAGRHREATAAFEDAFARLSALGRDDTDRAATLLNNWANTLHSLGRPLEAERLFRRVIAIRSADGTERNISAVVLSNLSGTLGSLHRFDEAADYGERALAKARASGDEQGVSRVLYMCARFYSDKGDLERASGMVAEVERRWTATMPQNFYGFGELAMVRSRLAVARDDLGTAIAEAEKAAAIIGASPQSRRSMPFILTWRAEVKLRLGRLDEARVDAAKAISLWQEAFGREALSCWTGHATLVLGRVLAAQGKSDEARAAYTSAAAHLQSTFGKDHPETLEALRGVPTQ